MRRWYLLRARQPAGEVRSHGQYGFRSSTPSSRLRQRQSCPADRRQVAPILMYVVWAVCEGKPFPQAVREAVDLGYAEPDPARRSTSGRDAARQALLVLARLMVGRRASTGRPHAPRTRWKLYLDRPVSRLSRSMRLEGARGPRVSGRPVAMLVSRSPRMGPS